MPTAAEREDSRFDLDDLVEEESQVECVSESANQVVIQVEVHQEEAHLQDLGKT